jgi:D-glycero-D-manno-heptose 1,7-bisphosphate phosphatase
VTDQPRPAVFLDRDGVLNEVVLRDGRPHPPQTVDELRVIDGVPEALAALKQAGFVLIVVTNQPDIARGTTTRAEVDAINDQLKSLLPLDDVYICPHDDDDNCDCRKPKPGMIVQASNDHNLDLTHSVVVGDRWRDIEMGRSAGVGTVFVDYGYSERQPQTYDLRVGSLAQSVEWICNFRSN